MERLPVDGRQESGLPGRGAPVVEGEPALGSREESARIGFKLRAQSPGLRLAFHESSWPNGPPCTHQLVLYVLPSRDMQTQSARLVPSFSNRAPLSASERPTTTWQQRGLSLLPSIGRLCITTTVLGCRMNAEFS